MKIMITGSAGFIGGGLLELFAVDGHSLIATYRNNKPTDSAFDIDFVRLDLADGFADIAPVDVIVHTAAHTHLIPDSTAEDYIRVNGTGMLNLLDYARRTRPKLFVFFSTLSVYGDITTDVLTEDTPLNKPEMYGLTKYMGELMLKEYVDYFPSVCLRLPGVVGLGYFMPWIGKTLQKAMAHEQIQIYNPESLFNNIIDIQELYRFISGVFDKGFEGCDAFNLAASEPVPLHEVIDLVVSLTNSRSEIFEQETEHQSFSISTERVGRVFGFESSDTKSVVQRYVNANLPVS